jgi:hypothetical protein
MAFRGLLDQAKNVGLEGLAKGCKHIKTKGAIPDPY